MITDNVKVFPYRYTYAATFSQPKTSTSYFAFCWFNYYDSTNNNVNPYFGIETITKRLTGFDILIQGKSDSGSVMQLHKLGISWLMADNAKLVPNF